MECKQADLASKQVLEIRWEVLDNRQDFRDNQEHLVINLEHLVLKTIYLDKLGHRGACLEVSKPDLDRLQRLEDSLAESEISQEVSGDKQGHLECKTLYLDNKVRREVVFLAGKPVDREVCLEGLKAVLDKQLHLEDSKEVLGVSPQVLEDKVGHLECKTVYSDNKGDREVYLAGKLIPKGVCLEDLKGDLVKQQRLEDSLGD